MLFHASIELETKVICIFVVQSLKILIMMSNTLLWAFGPYEIIAVLLLALLLFGGKKIPELARGMGKGIREFNSAKASIEDEIKEGMKKEDKKKLEKED